VLGAVRCAELYARGVQTLLASWELYSRGSRGAAVIRAAGVTSAVFPEEPERSVFNNAVFERDLGPAQRAQALDAMAHAYASASVERFAAWVHESDDAMRDELEARGYVLSESTRAMGMALADVRVARPELELAEPDWEDCVRVIGVPKGLLSGVDQRAFRVLVARSDGESAAAAMTLDHHDDCGIYNVGTIEHARRRGLGSAVTARAVHDAAERGCRTATLQSTQMAERVYAAVGFHDLGRFLEYMP
jgi:ribosomal protein S18 acetylase RimI-like enzyme